MKAAAPPPLRAYCAIPPGGGVDLDLIRRNLNSARLAPLGVLDRHWSNLAREGWTIREVTIAVGDDIDAATKPVAAPAPPLETTRPPAREGKTPGMPLLRCGE